MKYNKGDKIVVEIAGEDNTVGKCYCLGDGKHLMVALSQDWVEDNAQPLSDYIEDCTYEAKREIRKLKAENKKLKQDLNDLSSKSELNIEAARSFAHYDAWAMARRIVLDEKSGGFSGEDYIKIFGPGISTEAVFKKYSYADVADLVEKLEKERTEFERGDVVKTRRGSEFVVTFVNGDCLSGMAENGQCYTGIPKLQCVKTGSHVEVNDLLKKIGGEKNEDNL